MKGQLRFRQRKASPGGAAVEFLLCLPLLILLALPIADIARVIQANMILTNMAREGANLAARTTQQRQEIMSALAATAPPLDMRSRGMIRITKVLATQTGGSIKNIPIGQSRWLGGSYDPPGGVWLCGMDGSHWGGGGECQDLPPPSAAPSVPVMAGQLENRDEIILVEVFYKFPLLFESMNLGGGIKTPSLSPNLYAAAIFDYPGSEPPPDEKPTGGGGCKGGCGGWDDGGWGGGGGGGGPSPIDNGE